MKAEQTNHSKSPNILVFSTLFPSSSQPNAGVFIRERMFRVGQHLPVSVVSPVAWFPLQSLIRFFKPHFRPSVAAKEVQQGVNVYHPKFFSIPGILKRFDGLFLALSTYQYVKKLHQDKPIDIIDTHFAYPDGYAATLIGKWLNIPVTITLRGTEKRHLDSALKKQVLKALDNATQVFSVSDSLKQLAISSGAQERKIRVVGNGVDTNKFYPLPKNETRDQLNLAGDARVLVTVGGLVERKGFHRVIECLPSLIEDYPTLKYLIVGGASAEGNWEEKLKQQVKDLNLESHVIFLGPQPPDKLKNILSAADIFVLATRNEGWANVLLEAMACGLPIVTTDVGGNAEVVCSKKLGTIVPFGDKACLHNAIHEALAADWDIQYLIDYAKENSWDKRVEVLVSEFKRIHTQKVGLKNE